MTNEPGRHLPQMREAEMSTTSYDDRPRTRARAVVVGVVLLLLTAGTVTAASAYWSGRGTGSGTGASATPLALTLGPATPTAQLYPGGQAGVSLTATNPNTVSLHLTTLALDPTQGHGGFDVDAGHAACDTSTLSFSAQANGGAGWNVPASGSLSVTLPTSLAMGAGADNACQGAHVRVYLQAPS